MDDLSSMFLKNVDITLSGPPVSKMSEAFKIQKKFTLMRAPTKLVNSSPNSANHFMTLEFLPYIKNGPHLRFAGMSELRKDSDFLLYFQSIDYSLEKEAAPEIKPLIDFFQGLPENQIEIVVSQRVFFGLWAKDVQLKIKLMSGSGIFLIQAKYI